MDISCIKCPPRFSKKQEKTTNLKSQFCALCQKNKKVLQKVCDCDIVNIYGNLYGGAKTVGISETVAALAKDKTLISATLSFIRKIIFGDSLPRKILDRIQIH